MSLAQSPLQAYGLLDPVVKQQAPVYPVVTGSRAVSYQVTSPSSISDGSTGGQLAFDINPAHENVYVDRRMYLRLPVRMKINLPASTGVQTVRILQANAFGLRSFPAQKAMDTIVLNINGLPSSIEIGKILSALELFNIEDRLRKVDFSKCATYPLCQSTAFSDLFTLHAGVTSPLVEARNPLASNATSANLYHGGQFTVINNAATSGTAGEAWVDFVTVEPLYISPLYFGPIQDDNSAFLGVNSMSIQFNFSSGGGNRMIALDGMGAASPLFDTEAHARAALITCTMYFQAFTSTGNATIDLIPFTYQTNQSQAAVLVKQLAPSEIDENLKLKVKNYPYVQTRVWVTSIGAVASAGTGTAVSQNMQLSSVPSRVYAYVRAKDSVLRATPCIPDTFLQINNCAVQWGVDSRLNGASMEQLYDIACINGCELSWADWSANPINRGLVATAWGTAGNTNQYVGSGSVLAFGPMDLGLPLRQAPGKSEHFNLQVSVGYTNKGAQSLSCDLFVVVVSQGIFSIYDGQASALLGILSENDVLNANKQAMSGMLDYNEVRELYAGATSNAMKEEMQAALKKAAPVAAPANRKSLRERLA